MKPARAIEPKTLTMRAVADYLGLGSTQAAERWLTAHQVLIYTDKLGYNRANVREIDAANNLSWAEAEARPRFKEAG